MLNIMNPPADWSTMKKLIWLRGTPITGGEELTVTGTPPLSLPNSLGKPLKAWSVDVLPYQEGTGDPAPDNVRLVHGTDRVTLWTSGKNLLSYPYYFTTQTSNGCTATVADDGTVTFSGAPSNYATFNVKRRTDTTGNGSLYLQAGTYILNGCPAGGSSTTYQISVIAQDGSTLGVDRGSGLTITIPSGGMYIGVQLFVHTGYDPSALKMSPMIRLSSIADDTFTPYIAPSSSVITLPETIYTATIGSEGGESRTAKKILDGTEQWSVGAYGNYRLTISDMQSGVDADTVGLDCENLKPIAYNQRGQVSVPDIMCADGKYIELRNLSSLGVDSVDSLKTWLGSNNLTIVYPLATPIEFPITTPPIPTPRGNATTWATAEDGTVDSMEVTYVGKS